MMEPLHFAYDISQDVQRLLATIRDDVNDFQGKNILVTGGTGFFGRWLLKALCALKSTFNIDCKIYVLSRSPHDFLHRCQELLYCADMEFIQGDVVNFVLPNMRIDYVFHMATTTATETFQGEDQLNKVNMLYFGTRNVLEQTISKGLKKIIFTSSGVVYGPATTGKPFSEQELSAPPTLDIKSALGEGKRIAEYLISYYSSQYGFKFAIARCFSFAGQYLPLEIHYALGNFIFDALFKPNITIKGTGEEIRSYLYIGDAIGWLLKLMLSCDNQVYNVGSSESVTIKKLAEMVSGITGCNKDVIILGQTETEDNFRRNMYVPDVNKIKRNLNVEEWTTIDQIILKMMNYIR